MHENPYAGIYAGFQKYTENHRLVIEHDIDGHRTLYVGEPGTGMWSWRVITSPFYLTIVGDIADGYTFTRIYDMLDFFGRGDHPSRYDDSSPAINPHYWAEKLTRGGRESVKEYSKEVAIRDLKSLLDETETLGLDELKAYEDAKKVIDQIEEHAELGEHYLRDWLSREPQAAIFGQDTFWEHDFTEYTHDFILACYAIVKTVSLYRQQRREHNAGDGFIVVEGGLVQNDTALPVYDMDVLDSDQSINEVFDEMFDLYERILSHGDHRRPAPEGLLAYLPEIEQKLRSATGDTGHYAPQMIADAQERRRAVAGTEWAHDLPGI